MNRDFSPFLAHLLMAGLARRAASRHDLPHGRDHLDQPSPSDALDWGIAAFLCGKTKGFLSVPETLGGAEGRR